MIVPEGQDSLTFYRQFVAKFTNKETYNIDGIADMSLLYFDLIEQTINSFMDEKAFFVSFILTAYQNAQLNTR